jgi:CheY-like chemotaxis protein
MATIQSILLVEDDTDDQLIFRDAIRAIDNRMVCDVAPNGKVALEMLKDGRIKPQLIFVDINMPVMDGYTFLRHHIKSNQTQGLHVGMISTVSVIPEMKTSKALGAKFYLTKPKEFQDLCTKLKKILAADYSKEEFLIVI